jgi:hypothetical protein
MQLTVLEIPQIPGYRRESRSNKSIVESLTTTVYAVPIVIVNPYLAGGLFVDYLVRGRYHLIPKHLQIVDPENLLTLTAPTLIPENPESEGAQAPSVAASGIVETRSLPGTAKSGLLEIRTTHE